MTTFPDSAVAVEHAWLRTRPAVEWPTLVLIFAVYAAWLAITFWSSHLPLVVVTIIGAPILTLHSSLQHEILHGHPTRSRAFNRWLGSVPLSLWIPYESYRVSHLIHHRDERLTDPLDDPESYYWMERQWQQLSPVSRVLVKMQMTLAGRMLVGPVWIICRYWTFQAGLILKGDKATCRIWSEHALHLVPVVAWLVFVARMDLITYVLAMVYPGMAILLIRSFAEHRANPSVPGRTAIVEDATILGPLFLYNSLHSAHHEAPSLPWYRIPAWYRANRDRLIEANGGLVYHGYLDVARRYLFRPHDVAKHPLVRAP
ncbi:MAG: fatty acid desaturase [Ancalomicrobiaceae bacterium]|nr:fatty acid desaturase [Ancalomicrobiaceae bacterium]